MRLLILLLVFACSISNIKGQVLDSQDKKALKLVEKADAQIKSREFYEAIGSFKKAIQKDQEFSAAYYKLANLFSFLRLTDSAYSYYERYFQVSNKETMPAKTALALSSRFFQRGDYALALEAFETAKLGGDLESKDSLLKSSIHFAIKAKATPIEIQVQPMSNVINSFPLQYFPVMTINKRRMYYTRRLGSGPQYDEDIVLSIYENNQWSQPRSLSRNINSVYNEGACSVSADGNTLILTLCEGRKTMGNCDLFISKFDGVWGEPENLGREVNSPFWDSQPSLSADGKTLYFSSNRSGGFGQRDIWVTQFSDGKWEIPQNLGPLINTPYDETTPFIHFNNQSLFFSSQGHVGLGGFDLFKSERDTTSWTLPENLAYPINDEENQIGIFITADGREGLYTKDEAGRSVIYRMLLKSDSLVRTKTSYLTGTVVNQETKEPVAASLLLYDLKTQKRIYETESSPVDGSYFVAVNVDGEYGLFTQSPGFLFEDRSIDLESNFEITPDTLDIALKPVKAGNKLILKNIYFDFDSDQLQAKSSAELGEIARFLNQNRVLVEISGHTDQVGSASYNQDLSERRAERVYRELLDLGVSKESVTFIGYGDKKPLFIDENNGKNQLNRRIEFKIIKKLSD